MSGNDSRCSPDYIGIGFRRCGSSWLQMCLYEHPEIGHFKGDTSSGMHFFSREENYHKGIDWYEERLDARSDGSKVVGEFSVSYSYPDVYKAVADRICHHYPEAKLFCAVRNPIDRAYSDYRRSVLLGELQSSVSFEEAIKTNPCFVERGFYGRILQAYRSYLAEDRLLVLFYRGLVSNPDGYIKSVYDYLDVSPGYTPSVLNEKKGHAYLPRSAKLQRTISSVQSIASYLLRGIGVGFVLDGIKTIGLQEVVLSLNRARTQPLTSETRQRLYGLYKPDIEELSALLQEDLSFWTQ